MMTVAFIVVAFSAQALAWRCAKLSTENEQLKEQVRQMSAKAASIMETSTIAPATRPLVWD